MAVGFRLTGARATLVRPGNKLPAMAGNTWAQDRSSVSANDGTEIDATWVNRVKAELENLVLDLGGVLADADNQLSATVQAYVAARISENAANTAAAIVDLHEALLGSGVDPSGDTLGELLARIVSIESSLVSFASDVAATATNASNAATSATNAAASAATANTKAGEASTSATNAAASAATANTKAGEASTSATNAAASATSASGSASTATTKAAEALASANAAATSAASAASAAASAVAAEAADLASQSDAAKGANKVGYKPNRANAGGVTVRDELEAKGLRPENFSGAATVRAQVAACVAAAKLANAPIFMPGSYDMVGDGITIDWPAQIRGNGSLTRSSDVLVPIFNLTAGADRATIEGLKFLYTPGGATAGELHCAIRATGCKDVSLLRNTVEGKFYAGLVTNNAPDVLVFGNTLRKIVNRPIYCYIGSGRQRILANDIDGDDAGTLISDYGINVNDGGTTACVEIVIAQNIVNNTKLQGIEAGNTSAQIVIALNTLKSSAATGNAILVQLANAARGRKVIIAKNSVDGWDYSHIYQSDDVIVNGNQFKSATAGLLVTDSTGIITNANQSDGAASVHFWYANADNVIHTSNQSKGGAAYDVLADANCDRFICANNQRRSGVAGNFSIAATNALTGNNQT